MFEECLYHRPHDMQRIFNMNALCTTLNYTQFVSFQELFFRVMVPKYNV